MTFYIKKRYWLTLLLSKRVIPVGANKRLIKTLKGKSGEGDIHSGF